MAENFSTGAKLHRNAQEEFLFLPQQLHLGHNRHEDGAKYLMITKERIVLASDPYALPESFFIKGQKCPLWLHTPLSIALYKVITLPNFQYQIICGSSRALQKYLCGN